MISRREVVDVEAEVAKVALLLLNRNNRGQDLLVFMISERILKLNE